MTNKIIAILLLMVGVASTLQAQSRISGIVLDQATGKPLEGVDIIVIDKPVGTSTNDNGSFTLDTKEPLPLILEIRSIGYITQEVRVTQKNVVGMRINMEELIIYGEEVIVSASKVEESVLEAPVTVESLELRDIIHTPSFDVYGALANLKGVQSNNSSLTFTSVNTRGFGDVQNWRFIQLIDGVDASAPGLNYAVGGNSAPSDLDIASMELVPGANSALYGANAFNGLLAITTKDPFLYTGLSASVKTGVTSQNAGGTNPFYDFGFRYAQSVNDKFAFKVNVGYLSGTDWTADDESHYVSPASLSVASALLSRPKDHPNFDAVNVYGDEVVTSVLIDDIGTEMAINRTGIKEADIVNDDVQNIKASAGLYYRLTDSLEASYNLRFINGDAILRHTTMYPLVNFRLTNNVFQLKAPHWFLRAYLTQEDANDSYAMLATGAFLERGRKSNGQWGSDYGDAFRGEVPSVTAGSHQTARVYADRDLIPIESPDLSAIAREYIAESRYHHRWIKVY